MKNGIIDGIINRPTVRREVDNYAVDLAYRARRIDPGFVHSQRLIREHIENGVRAETVIDYLSTTEHEVWVEIRDSKSPVKITLVNEEHLIESGRALGKDGEFSKDISWKERNG
jgi:hypothetical protein